MEPYKVLVIDDNAAILAMLKLMLERSDYEVTIKDNTEQLEEILYSLLPDLLIMDVLLSGVDGRDICTTIRKNPDFSTLPIMMISALQDAEKTCLAAGAQYFLGKPFEMTKFNLIVKTAVTTQHKFQQIIL